METTDITTQINELVNANAQASANLSLAQGKVRDLYAQLNSLISENEISEEDDVAIKDINEIIERVFGNSLEFTRDYEVETTHTIKAVFTIRATSEESAREIADDITVSVDDSILRIDNSTTEVDELYIDETEVNSVEEK